MAQLVAHLLCKQGVTGSSPVSSTQYPLAVRLRRIFFYAHDGAGRLALSTLAARAALSHYGAGLRDPAAGPGDSAGVVVATAGTKATTGAYLRRN